VISLFLSKVGLYTTLPLFAHFAASHGD